jgi:NitT/TauT family transport system permease protein
MIDRKRFLVLLSLPRNGPRVVARLITTPKGKIFISVVFGLLLWEVAGQLVTPIALQPFSKTLVAFAQMLITGELLHHSAVSLIELSIGFGIGAFIGITGGLMSAFSKTFRIMTDHWISVAYAIPYVALTPLFVVWFGIGIQSKVILVIYAVFVPVWLNTYAGIAGVDPNLMEVAHSFGAKSSQVLKWVVLPFGLPVILTGLRLAFARGFIAVVVGEMIASTAGLGFLIDLAGGTFQVDRLLAALAVVVIMSLVMVTALNWFQRKTVPWWEEKTK